MDSRGTVGRIYKEDHFKFWAFWFQRRRSFLCLFHCKSMGANDPWGGAISDPRGMLGRIHVKLHITMLHTKYRSFGCCSFMYFPLYAYAPGAVPVWTPGARLAGIIKRTNIHWFTQNMKALGLVVSEKIFFYVFPIVSLWDIMTLGAGPFLTPGAWLAGFIKRTTTHCYIQNMKALGLVVF